MSYATYTWATLRPRLQDRWEDSPFWTDAEALIAINEAFYLWNLLTGVWRRQVTPAVVLGDPYVALADTLVCPMRVEWDHIPLTKSSKGILDQLRPGWEGETIATPGVPATTPQLWVPISLRMVAIWPLAAGTLTIDGVAATPVLSAVGDTVDLSDGWISAVLGYALHAAAFKDAGRFRATMPMLDEFYAAAGDVNAQLKASSFYRTVLARDMERAIVPLRVAPQAEEGADGAA